MNRCKRCGRQFKPKGDEIWGPTCARKMHAQLVRRKDPFQLLEVVS